MEHEELVCLEEKEVNLIHGKMAGVKLRGAAMRILAEEKHWVREWWPWSWEGSGLNPPSSILDGGDKRE